MTASYSAQSAFFFYQKTHRHKGIALLPAMHAHNKTHKDPHQCEFVVVTVIK